METPSIDLQNLFSALTIIVSVSSIFISNYLGRASVKLNLKMEVKKKCYYRYYLELIKKFYAFSSPEKITYKMFIQTKPDEKLHFVRFLMDNIEYLTPEIASLLPNFFDLSSDYAIQIANQTDVSDADAQEVAQKAETLFKKIILLSFEEGQRLSKELFLPDIAEPLLELFAKEQANR